MPFEPPSDQRHDMIGSELNLWFRLTTAQAAIAVVRFERLPFGGSMIALRAALPGAIAPAGRG